MRSSHPSKVRHLSHTLFRTHSRKQRDAQAQRQSKAGVSDSSSQHKERTSFQLQGVFEKEDEGIIPRLGN